jgi:hypothetical protein
MTRRELTDEQIEARMPKKAGRPASPAAQTVAVVVNDQATAQEVAAADAMAATHEAMDEVLAAGIDLGRMEGLEFIATVANSATLAIFENVKKSKAWRLLRNPKSCDGRSFESLAEFCEAKLGKSYRRLQELTSARNLIGQEAFEQAERLGLRQRDYNDIKALPAPDQELVRRAVEEAKSREEVLDLLQELVVRNAKEKEALTAQAEEAAATLEAKDRVLQTRAELIGKLEEQVAGKFKPLPGSEARTAQEQALLKELDEGTSSAFLSMHRTFKAADAALSGSGARDAIQARARQAVEFLAQQLADMCEEFGISVDLDERINPSWLSEDAIAAIEARNAANPHTNTRAQ